MILIPHLPPPYHPLRTSPMLTPSTSAPADLSGRKRKSDPGVDVDAVVLSVMETLRGERFFSAIEEDDWEVLTEKVRKNPTLPKTSRLFTEARPFYSSLFELKVGSIKLFEDRVADPAADEDEELTVPDVYREAAEALRKNELWENVREHVVMENETSCRTAIDLILLTAIKLAQQQIDQNEDVDSAIRARHSPDDNSSGWVVLHQEVNIPDQALLTKVSFHGVLDYLIGIVSAEFAQQALKSGKFLERNKLRIHSEFLDDIQNLLATITESKAKLTGHNPAAWAQVTAQGAAMTVLTHRPSVMATLTDGVIWRFVRISKIPDENLSVQRASSLPKSRPSPAARPATNRRKSDRLATSSSKRSSLPTVQEKRPPFKSACTRDLNIFDDEDLATILRLLTLTIIASPEKFVEQALAGSA
ncbi:hypothetical protein B0H19DRAFT_166741 [Mycena capillaripes]|nr:hypothetical protein B0H19DRAFT_166741 [Mycena capillaripes]